MMFKLELCMLGVYLQFLVCGLRNWLYFDTYRILIHYVIPKSMIYTIVVLLVPIRNKVYQSLKLALDVNGSMLLYCIINIINKL